MKFHVKKYGRYFIRVLIFGCITSLPFNLSPVDIGQLIDTADEIATAAAGIVTFIQVGSLIQLMHHNVTHHTVRNIAFQPVVQPASIACANSKRPGTENKIYLSNEHKEAQAEQRCLLVKSKLKIITPPPLVSKRDLQESVIDGIANALDTVTSSCKAEYAQKKLVQSFLIKLHNQGTLNFKIRTDELHLAQKRLKLAAINEEKYNTVFEAALKNRLAYEKYNDFLEEIVNVIGTAFGNKSALFEQRIARHTLLRLVWPTDFPEGSTHYCAFNNLKFDLQQLEYENNGNPKIIQGPHQQEIYARERAKVIGDFLMKIYQGADLQAVMDRINSRYNIFYLRTTLEEAQKPSTMMGSIASGTWQALQYTASNVKKDLVFLGHDVWFGSTSLASKIATNRINIDLDRALEYFLAGNLDQACALADAYRETPYYGLFIDPIKERFFKVNTLSGIPRCCENDPLWVNFPAEKKSYFQSQLSQPGKFAYVELSELKEIRATLIERWLQKAKLAQMLNIPRDHSSYVDYVLYKVITECRNEINIPGIIRELSHLSANSADPVQREAYDFFFNQQGICKLSGTLDLSLLAGIEFNDLIHLAEYQDVRKILNYLTTVAADTSEAQDFVRQGFKYCSKALGESELCKAYKVLAEEWLSAGVANDADKMLLSCGDFAQDFATVQQNKVRNMLMLKLSSVLKARKELAQNLPSHEVDAKNKLLHNALDQVNQVLNDIAQGKIEEAYTSMSTIGLPVDNNG